MHGENPASELALLCQAGERLCVLPMEHLVETLRPLPIQSLAGTEAFVLGLTVVRGEPVLVLDLQVLLGQVGRGVTRFVVIRVGDRKAALAVDVVLGLRAVPRKDLTALPPLARDARVEAVEAIGARDGGLLTVLRAARVVPGSAWSALDAAGAGR